MRFIRIYDIDFLFSPPAPRCVSDLDACTRKTALRQAVMPKSGDFERFLLPQSVKTDWGYFLTLKFFEILQMHFCTEDLPSVRFSGL